MSKELNVPGNKNYFQKWKVTTPCGIKHLFFSSPQQKINVLDQDFDQAWNSGSYCGFSEIVIPVVLFIYSEK